MSEPLAIKDKMSDDSEEEQEEEIDNDDDDYEEKDETEFADKPDPKKKAKKTDPDKDTYGTVLTADWVYRFLNNKATDAERQRRDKVRGSEKWKKFLETMDTTDLYSLHDSKDFENKERMLNYFANMFLDISNDEVIEAVQLAWQKLKNMKEKCDWMFDPERENVDIDVLIKAFKDAEIKLTNYSKTNMRKKLKSDPEAAKKVCKALLNPKKKYANKEIEPYSMGDIAKLPHDKFIEKMHDLTQVAAAEKNLNVCKFPKVGDNCDTGKASTVVNLLAQQKFIARYLTVQNPFKGLYVFHSVGSGKTCALIAAASNTFHNEDWAVIWVTRRSLKTDVYKNIHDTICHQVFAQMIKEDKYKMPRDEKEREKERKRIMPNFLEPVTYKEFGNFMRLRWPTKSKPRVDDYGSGANLFQRMLAFQKKRKKMKYYPSSGRDISKKDKDSDNEDEEDSDDDDDDKKDDETLDMIANTLIIIDEAHRIFSTTQDTGSDPDEIITAEQAKSIKKRIQNSYRYSEADSCKVVLMSATPFCETITPFFKQLNLIIDGSKNELLPEKDEEEFLTQWTNSDTGNFLPWARNKFLKATKGIISYLNQSQNASKFPVVRSIVYTHVELGKSISESMKEVKKVKPDKQASYIQSTENFAPKLAKTWPQNYRFWTKSFAGEELRDELEHSFASPKFMALYNTIKWIDKRDMQSDNHYYKHAIFVSTKSPQGASGPWALASCFVAFNWIFVQNPDLTIDKYSLRERSPYKFCVLSGTNPMSGTKASVAKPYLLGQFKDWCKMSRKQREKWENKSNYVPDKGVFNNKYKNKYGELIRFIIFDQNYTEGVDMFDVKYLHVFTPQLSTCLLTQAVGRVTRFCGMAGLNFVPGANRKKNKVTVYIYNGQLHKKIRNKFGEQTDDVYALAQSYTTKMENVTLINEILNLLYLNAVDRRWLQNMNPKTQDIELSISAKKTFKRLTDGNAIYSQEAVEKDPYKEVRVKLWKRRKEGLEDKDKNSKSDDESDDDDDKPRKRRGPKPKNKNFDAEALVAEASKNMQCTIECEGDSLPDLDDENMLRLTKASLRLGETPESVFENAELPDIWHEDDLTEFQSKLSDYVEKQKKRLPREISDFDFENLDPETQQALKHLGKLFATSDVGKKVTAIMQNYDLHPGKLDDVNKIIKNFALKERLKNV
jgi:hypothetical protein